MKISTFFCIIGLSAMGLAAWGIYLLTKPENLSAVTTKVGKILPLVV